MEPVPVEGLLGKHVMACAAGSQHTVVLTTESSPFLGERQTAAREAKSDTPLRARRRMAARVVDEKGEAHLAMGAIAKLLGWVEPEPAPLVPHCAVAMTETW